MNALSSSQGSAVLDNHMSIQAAAEYSGYNLQYLRRIVRKGEVEGVKVGQVWLVNLASLDAYLKRVQNTDDRRYGPRVYQTYISSQLE
jgi:excisionase family DNA binding protein